MNVAVWRMDSIMVYIMPSLTMSSGESECTVDTLTLLANRRRSSVTENNTGSAQFSSF